MNGHTNENQALAPVPTTAVPQREAVTTTIILYPTTNNVENTDPIRAVGEDPGINGMEQGRTTLVAAPITAVGQRQAVTAATTTTTIILYPITNNVENTDPIPAVREDHGMEPRRTGASVTTTIILYATPTHRNSGTE